jgi:DnaJ-domain-containing protein 1
MFSKADPANNLKRVRVSLKTRLGENEIGAILVPAHHTLRQALNDDGPFIEIEAEDGRRAFLLKTEIARIDPHDTVEPRAFDRGPDDWTRFDANDARLVLGVAADATEQELHTVWRDLAKAYHPDRLAALGLPDEILRHADRVLSRINAAYQRLKTDASARRE